MIKKINQMGSDVVDYVKSWIKTFSAGLAILSIILLFLLPFIFQDPSFQNVILGYFVKAMIFSILAASWDLMAGIAGQVSFGHAVFFGVGSYAYAVSIYKLQFSLMSSILIAIIFSVLIGLIVGLLCLRVKGPYLALVTMTLGIIFLRLFLSGELSEIFYGTGGISNLPQIFPNPIVEYLIILIVMIITIICLIGLSKSKFGTILKSIRDDETGARASGINTNKYKIIVFIISALVAGIAGIFYAMYNGIVTPTSNFSVTNSFYPIIMVSLGGIGTIVGGAVGAYFFFIVQLIIVEFVVERLNLSFEIFGFNILEITFIFAVILILVILFAKKGILKPGIERLRKLYDLMAGK